MRGLYAHASHRMRDDLKAALQARWEQSLSDRAAIHPRSPVPLLDELLAPLRGETEGPAEPTTPRITQQHPLTPGSREKMISQLPPNQANGPTQPTRMEPVLRASDLARYQESGRSGAKRARTADPLLAKSIHGVQHRLWPGIPCTHGSSRSRESRLVGVNLGCQSERRSRSRFKLRRSLRPEAKSPSLRAMPRCF